MVNYYELIYLNKELNEKVAGTSFEVAISPHKDVLESFLQMNSDSLRLIFSANPNETALFLDQYRPPKKSNVLEFFKRLEGQKIVRTELAEYDRLEYIYFDNGMYLLFKLYGSNPNALLVHNDEVIDAFKNPDNLIGTTPPKPETPSFSDEVNPEAKPKNQITRLNPLLPRNLISILVDQYEVDTMNPGEVKKFVEWITGELKKHPDPRVLVTGETCLWSKKVLDLETDRSFKTMNDAVRHAYRNRVHARRLHRRKNAVIQMLERSLNKSESKLEQLKQADKSLERADEYEKYGHLLMANAHETVSPETENLEVKDYYGHNESVQIPIKGRLSIADNARHYYEKAKEARQSFENAKRRIGTVKNEIEELRGLIDELEGIDRLPRLEKWIKENEERLHKYGYGSGDSKQASSPFRKFRVDKYEVWIGKSAESNDKLIGVAHKEDVWLHARGLPGSHVVIRMGNRKQFPPKRVILQAAGYAAFYSKARGMKTVPVMYTKVKYVRKPKNSDPGAVRVEREKVEMVPPLEPK